ncbi:MAG: histidine triad nucleotide-binding protein [Clostridiales bacterium]|nr:histidine triad nucleotide-binding protein [Clostridiales bacterium]
MDCIFCKIGKGEAPCTKVYEDDLVIAFEDLDPVAPTHVLIIPKQHIDSAADVDSSNSHLISRIFEVASSIAKEEGLDKGFSIVTNAKEHGGQTVSHLHFHLIGGKKLDIQIR